MLRPHISGTKPGDSQRIHHTGYRLLRKPEEYTVGEILELTEGTLATVACLEKGADACPRQCFCKTLPMWQKFDTIVHDYFYNITIADLDAGNI